MHRFALASALALCAAPAFAADRPFLSAGDAAAAVDRVVAESLAAEGVTPAPPANDDDFLRRVSLDVAGRLPDRAERDAFDADWDDDRHVKAVDRLVGTRDYAENWAAYWTDVIFTRATDRRGRLAEPAFRSWLADELHAGAGWDAVAAEVITATGTVGADGAAGLFAAHNAAGPEVAAEASRIFLGVQIQCAECHDHPYDRWKREDFHALAAYFPRVKLRRTTPAGRKGPPGFEVVGDDRAGGDPEQIEKRVKRLREVLVRRFVGVDRNRDGGLDLAELKRTPAGPRADRVLNLGDSDGDGKLSREEAAALSIPPQALANVSKNNEHFMPDLENPERPGTAVDPAFFLTGETLTPGLRDADRRAAAAAVITDEDNVWFARAAVNRVWAELTGDGFYSPVDDIGPDRSARLEPAMNILAEGFVANGHDLRWLVRAVVLTEVYQRSLDADAPAFAAAKPARLRANQIYNSVARVAGLGSLEAGRAAFDRFGARGRGRRGGNGKVPATPAATKTNPYAPPGNGLERLLAATFAADPGTAREDLTGDVPQALFLMNGPLSGRLAGARGLTPLARLLREYPDPAGDPAAVAALYDLVLVRPPTPAEDRIALDYLNAAPGGRAAAFEDLMWALLNGSEFLTKR